MKRYCGVDMVSIKENNLTLTKWVILENINFLSNYTGWCENTRGELAEFHDVSTHRMRQIITELVDEKWLLKNKKFQLKTTKKWVDLQGMQKLTPPYAKTNTQGMQKLTPSTYKKELRENKAPTLEEITAYIQDKNLNVDANRFYNYFDAGNWIDSKGNKVKNWKQKILTWDNHAEPQKEEKVTLWA